ncbi:MAG: ABC transporter ATP-binding protein, partial [Pseudomonadota bacterium]
RALQRRLGATMVYVTHDQVEAMSMADRVVVLHGGTIQQIGTPEALFERPANRFVAGFIGAPAMNLIAVESTEGARSAAGALLPEPLAAAAEIGIRPQHLRLAPGGEDWLMWEGTVEQVEPLGGETLLHLRVGDETLRLRHEGSARTVPGTVVRFGADPACLHAFDARGAALPPA